MSKFFQRIGAKAVKFTFDVQILQVKMKMDSPCFVQVLWTRGLREIRTSRNVWLNHRKGEANFSEVLSLDSTLFQKNGSERFQLKKKSEFSVLQINGKYEKKLGEVTIDLSELVNQEPSRHKEVELNLTKCKDKNAKIKLSISWNKIGDIVDFYENDMPTDPQKFYARKSSVLSPEMLRELELKQSKQNSQLSAIQERNNQNTQNFNNNNPTDTNNKNEDISQNESETDQKIVNLSQTVLPYHNTTEEEQEEKYKPTGNSAFKTQGPKEMSFGNVSDLSENSIKQANSRTTQQTPTKTANNNNTLDIDLEDECSSDSNSNKVFPKNNGNAKNRMIQPQNKQAQQISDLFCTRKDFQNELANSMQKQQQIVDLTSQKNKLEADYRELRAAYQDCVEQLEVLRDKQATVHDVNENLSEQRKKILDNQAQQQEQIIKLQQKLALKESLIVKLQKQIEFIQLSNANLYNGNEEAKQVIKQEQLKAKQLLQDTYELRKSLDKAEDERESAQKYMHKSQIELETIQFHYNQLLNQADKKEKDHDRQIENFKQEIIKKDGHIARMKERLLEVIQNKKRSSLKDRQILENQKGKDEEYIKLLEKREKEMEDQSDKIAQLQQALLESQAQCEEIKNRFQRYAAKMNDSMESKNDQLGQLEQELTEFRQDNSYEQIQQLKNKNKELREINKKQKEESDKEIQGWKDIVQKSKLQLKFSQQQLKHNETKRFSLQLVTTEKQQLQLENQKLQQRIEEITNSGDNESANRLIKELRRADAENRNLREQLLQFKLRISHEEQKFKESTDVIEDKEIQIRQLDQDLKAIQKDVMRIKQKYGDALNACLEYGGPELVDLIVKGPDMRNSMKRQSIQVNHQ